MWVHLVLLSNMCTVGASDALEYICVRWVHLMLLRLYGMVGASDALGSKNLGWLEPECLSICNVSLRSPSTQHLGY